MVGSVPRSWWLLTLTYTYFYTYYLPTLVIKHVRVHVCTLQCCTYNTIVCMYFMRAAGRGPPPQRPSTWCKTWGDRERECVCEREREREMDRDGLEWHVHSVHSMCVCVAVNVANVVVVVVVTLCTATIQLWHCRRKRDMDMDGYPARLSSWASSSNDISVTGRCLGGFLPIAVYRNLIWGGAKSGKQVWNHIAFCQGIPTSRPLF